MITQPRGMLGIKTADGTIVEVLDFRNQGTNTEVFTTTVDRQKRARFDFFYRERHSQRWSYLDNLLVNWIPPARAGDPDLKIQARADEKGNLLLGIKDSGSGKSQVFVVDGAALAARCCQPYDTRPSSTSAVLPVAAGSMRVPPTGSSTRRPGGPYEQTGETPKRGRGRWIVPVLILPVVVLVALLAGRKLLSPDLEETRAAAQEQVESGGQSVVVESAENPIEAATADTRQQPQPNVPAAADEPAAVVESLPEIASTELKNPAEEMWREPEAGEPHKAPSDLELYRITWGDTLWRITERFYGDRDLYRQLAEGNNLNDPDYIIAGEALRLPPALRGKQRKSGQEETDE